jgi:pyrroloquinoline-quinone synthase
MNLHQHLTSILERWNLLRHPFYKAWSAGELPKAALGTYAREYGHFIARLPEGWQTLNDADTAQEEQEHVELWEAFAEALDAKLGEAQIPEVRTLSDTARALFSQTATAAGALYAFEVQQPATAQSKLEGLKAFYHPPAKAETYFEVHSRNQHEAEKLLARMEGFAAEEQAESVRACEVMSQALWDALSGIFDDHECRA